MGYSVQERAESIGTFRWIEIQLMRLLAQWIPTTPEMEVKVLLGRHVWECARHADEFGKRAFELRAPLQYTLPAADEYRAFLAELSRLENTNARVAALYDVLFPMLARRYRAYLEATDRLMDEPSVRVLESALADIGRMEGDRRRLLEGVDLGPAALAVGEWRAREMALESIVAHGAQNVRARGLRA